MVVTLEPKTTFQSNPDHLKEYRATIDNAVFKEGIHKAISEFVLKYNPTAEELQGVRRFMAVLLNMAEQEDPIPKTPYTKSIEDYFPKPQPKK